VQQAFYVTGEADFILVIAARDTEAFDGLMATMVADNPNILRFTTNVALSIVKRSLFVPIATDAE
jgi:Lrp/AsnC family transcriptional regulator, leucine-responsive regulatory protein